MNNVWAFYYGGRMNIIVTHGIYRAAPNWRNSPYEAGLLWPPTLARACMGVKWRRRRDNKMIGHALS